jgi:hypothetical protein
MADADREVPLFPIKLGAKAGILFDFTELFPAGTVISVDEITVENNNVTSHANQTTVAGLTLFTPFTGEKVGYSLCTVWAKDATDKYRESLQCNILVE